MQEAVKFRFGADVEISIAMETYSPGHGDWSAVPWAAALIEPAEAWVIALATVPIFEEPHDWSGLTVPGSADERSGKQLYILEPHGLIHLLEKNASGVFEVRLGSTHEPYLDEHVFSRLSPRGFRGNAYPFPYGGYYEALASAFGPIKSFGFRFAEDLMALERREEDTFVATVFGGSCALSPACLQDETFSSQLAGMLNEHFNKVPGRYRTAHVLNFGNSGATVLNELITYLLFAQRVAPEIVIAHDIFNDFAHGLRTDPVLLGKYQITYLPEMERWAQILMGTSDVPLSQHADGTRPFDIRSGPQVIVKAYIARKRQFMETVERAGSEFIYGIQPAWFAKHLAPRELAKITEIRRLDRHNVPIFECMERLYEMAIGHLHKNPPKHFVDVNAEFARFGADTELFVDHAHLNPAGDRHVAETYFNHIMRHVLPQIH